MKIFPAIFCCLVFITTFSFAQKKDKKAQEILDGVSAKYKSYKSVQADFVLKAEAAQTNMTDQQAGTLYVRGDKYKIELKDQDIISDGKTMWTYVRKANEVQVNSVDPGDEETMTPNQIFTIYEKNFLYAYIEDQKVNGKTLQIIDLTPNDKSKPYSKIRLAIDQASKTIQSAALFNRNGNRYTYEIKKFTADPAISDDLFTFNKANYPGVEVNDLR
ncbi:MAG: outer membrane lipoprotein carrier protein LolA [Chitinophagales bacterium]|nr:outer membrane lipoprotein carrier protein LolA [Chitinophagales bacterium]